MTHLTPCTMTTTLSLEGMVPAVIFAVMHVQPNDVIHFLQHGLQMPELLVSAAPEFTPESKCYHKERGDQNLF